MYVCTWVLLVFLFFHPCISLSFTCHSTDKVLLSTCIGHTKKERTAAVRVCRNFACCETCTLPGWRFVGGSERGVEGGEGRGGEGFFSGGLHLFLSLCVPPSSMMWSSKN